MDCMYELSKYRGIQIDPNGPAIILFHNYQRLVTESRREGGLDPYPNKNIMNFDALVKAIQAIAKNIMRAMGAKI